LLLHILQNIRFSLDILQVCLSVYPLSVYTIYLLAVFLCLSVYLSVCLSIYLSVCLSIYLSVYLQGPAEKPDDF